MPLDQESQVYQFTLVFQSVKMKVKFPCKLALEHGGNLLTNQVSANEQNKFLINEQVVIKDQSQKKYLEIVVNLITQKGSKYIAGIIKLFHNQLLRSEGQRIVVALAKCLDSQAFCEVKVQKIVTQKITKRNPLMGPTKGQRDYDAGQQSFSPAQNGNFRSLNQASNQFGTRSQAQFITNNNNKLGRQWQQKRQTCALTYYQKNSKPSPPKARKKLGDTSRLKYNQNLRIKDDQQNINRQKLIQAQVYKQNYQKLKQKYRKQSQNYKVELTKRISLQNNENNYKLQIVRLRLKCQEAQKLNNEKTIKLREIQSEFAVLQQKDIDISYYKQQSLNLKTTISMLQDTIITLNNENQKIKQYSKQRQHEFTIKLQQLQTQYQKVRVLYSNKQQQYDRDVRIMKQQLIQLQYQLHNKNQQLQKQKNYIYQFEKNSQNKLFQFDTLLQNQRNNHKIKYEEMKQRVDKLQLENKQLFNQKKQLEAEKQSHKSYIIKTQYQYKLQLQQFNTIRNQLEQLHTIKQKYNKVNLQIKLLKEEKQVLIKTYQKNNKNKQINYENIIDDIKKQSEFIKKVNSQINQKNKGFIQKNIQLEGLTQSYKNTIQKHKRSLQSITKEFTELKQKQKNLKKTLSQKQETIDDYKEKLQKANSKHNNVSQSKRLQYQKMNQIISKFKIDLQSQSMRNTKLNENNSQLSHELSRIKMMLQFAQEKVQKTTISAQQKYKSYEAIIQEHEGVISMLEQNINDLKKKETDIYNKLSLLQNQYNSLKQLYDRQGKQNKILTQKLSSQQGINRQKSLEFSSLLAKYENSEHRNQALQSQLHQVKTELSMTKSQKQKTLKMLEIANAQNQKCREGLVKLSAENFEKENKVETKTKDLSRLQDQLQKLYYKTDSFSKQYSKFKETFIDLMSNSYKQYEALKQETGNLLLNLGGPGYTTSKQWENTFSNPYAFSEKKSKFISNSSTDKGFTDIANFTTQILNNFSSYSKESQFTMNKLIQKNKYLSSEIEGLKADLSQQIAQNQQIKYQTQRQKQQVQEQLRSITHQKGSQSIKFSSLIDQLKHQIYQKDQAIQQLNSQLDELQFTLSSNKMDYNSSFNEIDKKNYQLKQIVEQLEQKIDFQHNVITSLQQKCYESDRDMIDIKNSLVSQKQLCYKKQTQIESIRYQIIRLEQVIEAQKQKSSKLLQVSSNLQIQLSSQRDSRQKLQRSLKQEQQKKKQLKAFSAHIIKEKQSIIKQQLQHHQKLSALQNQLHQYEQHKQLLLEEIESYKVEIATYRQEIKKLNQMIKDCEKSLGLEKTKTIQSQKFIKEKERNVQQLEAKIKEINKISESKENQLKKSIVELNQQISYISNHKQKLTEDMNQKIMIMDKEIKNQQIALLEQKSQMHELEQLLYVQKEKSKALQQSLITKDQQVNEFKYRVEHLQALQNDLEQQSKDKQENMYELSATIYQLQSRITTVMKQKQVEIEEANNEWNIKYEELYQELEQRFELLEKQKQYLKDQITQKQQQISKKTDQRRLHQAELQNSKRLMEDKIKKLQEERLAIFTSKNSQIQKQSEQIKQLFQASKKKQAQNRKLSHEIQIARNQIMKLDSRLLQYDQKIKNINKSYQQQLEQMKKKQTIHKNFRQQVISQQWNTQRQIRKALQAYTKNILSFNDQNRQKSELMQMIKVLQSSVIGSIRMFDQKQ